MKAQEPISFNDYTLTSTHQNEMAKAALGIDDELLKRFDALKDEEVNMNWQNSWRDSHRGDRR